MIESIIGLSEGQLAYSKFSHTVEVRPPLREAMRIIYDWRLARVIDEDLNILDEAVWTASRSSSKVANRLGDLQRGRMTQETRVLSERFPDARLDPFGHLDISDWPEVTIEEEQMVASAATILARRGVAMSAGDPDRRLDMLVSSQTELRSAWTTIESRCIEWAGLLLPTLDLDAKRDLIPSVIASSESLQVAASDLGTDPPPHPPGIEEWCAMKESAERCIGIAKSLELSEQAIRSLAANYLPTLSKLVGPLGAAKLCVLAGGRERLARMPSGSIQVLGAHAAMAAHRRGAPPPKHGSVIFSMPQVSRSPRWVRGKIARFLAGKASIASRIDHFDGTPWSDDEIAEIHKKSEEIRSRFPSPPRRK